MRNIRKIFHADLRRLTASAVAVVIIMGLCLVPCLYAWFNILSNWDPYGPDSTGNIRVAVSNDDNGIDILGLHLNVGDLVIEKLHSNDQMGWVFMDNTEEAMESVRSGDCYAALVVPEDFTGDLFSIINDELKHPQIIYYENNKKNAIAPKITNKAKNAVQDQINDTLAETVGDVLHGARSVLHAFGIDPKEAADRITQRLDQAVVDLGNLEDTLQSLQGLLENADTSLDRGGVTLGDLENVLQNSKIVVEDVDKGLADIGDDIANANDVTAVELSNIDSQLADFDILLRKWDGGETARTELLSSMTALRQRIAAAEKRFPDISDVLSRVDGELAQIQELLEQWRPTDTMDKLIGHLDKARDAVHKALLAASGAVSDRILSATSKIHASLDDVENALNLYADKTNKMSSALSAFSKAMGESGTTVAEAIALTDTVQGYARQMADDAHRIISSEAFKNFTEIMENSPESIAEYLASPVKMNTTVFYEIDSYGAAMAPYYIMLALFVGSLLATTMIRVPVEPLPLELADVRPWQKFFGRYLLFFCIGMTQALITSLGCLYYIDIQCIHPLLFILACCVCSLNFTLMNYALVYALDNIGMAAAVIIMVIQVAGSGGSYPIDVLPEIFRKLYPFMPFHYGMDMVRETIGGRYGNTYWHCMGIMFAMCGIFLLLGFLRRPTRFLNQLIARDKEASGIM